MKASSSSILTVLDDCAKSFNFPALDNGYVYPAAIRLSLFRQESDWAIVFEDFGFSPRAGSPYNCIYTFASQLTNRKQRSDFVSNEAYETYFRDHPNDETNFIYPIQNDDWQDPDNSELLAFDIEKVTVRDESISVPNLESFSQFGIKLQQPDRISVFEFCRFLNHKYRELILATPLELRFNIPDSFTPLLQINEWYHPDITGGELPSDTETFKMIEAVLLKGDPTLYKPSMKPNTHWSNWPDGGTL
jgi:hypothetical protein